MNKIVTRLFVILMVIIVLSSCIATTTSNHGNPSSRDYTVYECDGKFWSIENTKIKVFKENEYFGTIKGSLFTFVTDPLTFYNANDKKIAYAGDTYHFINQDSHGIYVNGNFTCDLVGDFEMFGQEYQLYDFDENLIGNASFSMANFNGKITDSRGNIVAEYTSSYLFRDFTVKIYDNCEIDEITVLMIFASYYSDYHYDSET